MSLRKHHCRNCGGKNNIPDFIVRFVSTVQGHLFIAVNCAEFRGTATSQKREFRGHFAAKIGISRPKF